MGYKDEWADAYYAAMEDGMSERQAERMANRAATGYAERILDRADYARMVAKENAASLSTMAPLFNRLSEIAEG